MIGNFNEALNKIKRRDLNNLSYKQKIKILRYFRNDFNIDLRKRLTRGQKRKTTMAMRELESLTSRPDYRLVRPRKNRTKILKAVGQSSKYKIAIVPVLSPHQSIQVRNNTVVISNKFSVRENLFFNKFSLIDNVDKEVRRVLKNKRFDAIHIMTGDHLYGKAGAIITYASARLVAEAIKRLMSRYSNSDEWLKGIQIIRFKNQRNRDEFYKYVLKNAREKLKKRKNVRRQLNEKNNNR